ncbi:MAG: FemAB family PEP-CTERM system-associated protein [candidate division Zixibacteria bacterium]|nr:FemAB family PEP-CTERM system-associated protein [candidate division Zixibacteria bacterium]
MIEITSYSDQHRAAWNDFVAKTPSATIAHAIGWREVMHNALGHTPHYLLALDGSHVKGVLPLFLVQTWWRAKYLISVPWIDYGGVCSDDPEATSALLNRTRQLAVELNCQFAEFRSVSASQNDLPTSENRVSFWLRLPDNPDELWRGFDPKLRNQIRKSQKSELTTELGGKEMLPGFYGVFSRNMRDLGTPVWGIDLFDQVLTHFPDSARVIQVKKDNGIIAGGLLLSFKDRLYVPSASANRDFLGTCPNHALYWRVIEDGCREKYRWFDFGRSAVDSGTYRFKQQWVPEPVRLHWQYSLNLAKTIPEINPRNPKYRLFINMWRRMPLPLANFLGPKVIRNFP